MAVLGRWVPLAIALLLTGCVAAPAAPSPAESSALQPPVTPAAPVLPSCDSLVDKELLATLMGVEASELTLQPRVFSLTSAAMAQGGLMGCNWNAAPREEDQLFDASLRFYLGGAAPFAAYHEERPPVVGVLNSLSEGSSLWCELDWNETSCDFQFAAGEHWAAFSIYGSVDRPAKDSEKLATDFGRSVIDLASAAKIGPPLSIDEAFGADLDCASLAVPFEGLSPYKGDALSGVFERYAGGMTSCYWHLADDDFEIFTEKIEIGNVSFDVAPGAAWAISDAQKSFTELPPEWDVRRVDIVGADSATEACLRSVECSILAVVDDSLIELTVNLSMTQGTDRGLDERRKASAEYLASVIAQIKGA